MEIKNTLNAGGRIIDLATPKVMGIINITPDSFYSDSRKTNTADILAQAGKMLAEGADILDLGAYSSRPGAEHIPASEELARLLPAIEVILHTYPDTCISADTFRADVARQAVQTGAQIINDISGGTLDPDMFASVAELQVPYILMHIQGTPQTMQNAPAYDDVFQEVFSFFLERSSQLNALGLHDLIIDPGFGFGKTIGHNYHLLNRLQDFSLLGLPLLAGVSRKSMLYKIAGGSAETALNATTAANTIALMKGAKILRVHDVKEAREAVQIVQALG
jgi:dihydropteroate synthase